MSGKLGLDFHVTDDVMLYASASRGFKSGGFKAAIAFNASELDPFDPEELDAYELGVKSTLADGRLRLNAAAYYNDWRDFQAFITENRSGINVIVLSNAGDAEVKGFEAEIAFAPVDGLDLTLGANWMDTEITKFNTVPGAVDATGNELANAPEWMVNATARYEFPVGGGNTARVPARGRPLPGLAVLHGDEQPAGEPAELFDDRCARRAARRGRTLGSIALRAQPERRALHHAGLRQLSGHLPVAVLPERAAHVWVECPVQLSMTMSAAGANDSLWYHTATARPPIPRSRGAVRADVAVVGGGLTGLSAALHLLEKGAQVVVVEADEIGSGASGRNGGFVVPHFARGEPDDVVRNLGEGGERLVASRRQLGPGAVRARRATRDRVRRRAARLVPGGTFGGCVAHARAARGAVGSPRAERWRARCGRDVATHRHARLFRQLEQRKRRDRSPAQACAWTRRGGARAAGEIRENCGVERLTRAANGWQLATVDGEVSASEVLVCTNALSWTLLPALASAVTPATIIQVATEPIAPPARAHLLGAGQGFSDTRINLFTYRFDAQWRLITGALPSWFRGDRRLRAYLAARLQKMLSLPAAPKIDYLWSGRASVGPNFLPAIYAVDKGVHASAGCNGRGVAMALEMGRVLAESSSRVAGTMHRSLIASCEAMKGSRWKQWGVRWYPIYGAVKDRLEQFVGS